MGLGRSSPALEKKQLKSVQTVKFTFGNWGGSGFHDGLILLSCHQENTYPASDTWELLPDRWLHLYPALQQHQPCTVRQQNHSAQRKWELLQCLSSLGSGKPHPLCSPSFPATQHGSLWTVSAEQCRKLHVLPAEGMLASPTPTPLH